MIYGTNFKSYHPPVMRNHLSNEDKLINGRRALGRFIEIIDFHLEIDLGRPFHGLNRD